ncbi:hypothetical protein NMR91_003058 [Vibrio alginolyticus]|nr:hypothetical protein [Vibrio alginolyticus]
MTKNIEERTLAATTTLESSAKTVDEIAHTDKVVETPVGQRKSFPKIAKEWDDESTRLKSEWGSESQRLQAEWNNESTVLREDWRNERDAMSIKALGVKPWESGVSETELNQQRRWTDNHTYLPKTVPALMGADGPDENWIPYTADKSDTLNDVFGRKPIDLLSGVLLAPDLSQHYPKLNAFGKVWELDDGDQQYTVKSFAQTADDKLIITLNDDAQIIATRMLMASQETVDKKSAVAVDLSMGMKVFPQNTAKSLQVGDVLPAGTEGVQVNGQVYALVPENSGTVSSLDVENLSLYFEGGGYSKLHYVVAKCGIYQLRSDGAFFFLWNTRTDILVMRFAHTENPSDAHLSMLPFEVRSNGHSFISSADTPDGSVDQIFRTHGFSDYMYLFGKAPYGDEWFGFSGDVRPARPDGTKKNGTQGEWDHYAFDDSLVFPSNRPGNFFDYSCYVKASQWPLLMEQGVAVKRRGRGQYGYLWRYQDDINTEFICVENLNKLLEFRPESVAIGKSIFRTASKDYTQEPYIDDYYQPMRFDHYVPDVKPDVPLKIKLVKSGISKIAKVTLNLFTGAGGDISTWYWKKEIQFNSVGTITTIEDVKSSNITGIMTIDFEVDVDGDLCLSVLYAGGWGGSLRVSIAAELI